MKTITRMMISVASLTLIYNSAQATTISTLADWDGSTSINAWGGSATSVYGETFVAPGGDLTSFTFEVNDEGTPANYQAQVYSWTGSLTADGSGAQGAVGPALFTSAPMQTSGDGQFDAVTIDTGRTALATGQNYVVLLADTDPNDNSSGEWGLTGFFSHPGEAGDGGFNFYNNDYTLGSVNNGSWDSFADFGSLAYSATFADASNLPQPVAGQSFAGGVPEPASWALMMIGFGVIGATMRRRRIAAASI